MAQKDWTGNKNSTFTTLGASNHCTTHEREANDYYATDPRAVELLLGLENFSHKILEPCCGTGHISKVLEEAGHEVDSRDLVDRGYGKVSDFLATNEPFDGDIITNPPYAFAQECVEKALQIVPKGHKVAMFLKITFLEGKKRKKLFSKTPPRRIWVSSSRLKCAMNGEFDTTGGSATAYAWYIWEKGWNGDTVVKWFN